MCSEYVFRVSWSFGPWYPPGYFVSGALLAVASDALLAMWSVMPSWLWSVVPSLLCCQLQWCPRGCDPWCPPDAPRCLAPGCRSAGAPETADVVVLLEDGDVRVAEAAEESGAADGGRAAAEQRHRRRVALGSLTSRGHLGRHHLTQLHALEHLWGRTDRVVAGQRGRRGGCQARA